MAYEFKLPDLGEGLTEGEIARWLVAEGQEIAEDDPLVEIQTDKTTVEIPSPAAGVVSRIFAAEGDIVPVGQVIVVIGDGSAGDRRSRSSREPPPRHGSRSPDRTGTDGSGRRRSSDASRTSSASIWPRSPAPALRAVSPKTTCEAPRRTLRLPKDGANACEACGA